MTDHANELRRHARKIPHPQGETPGVMLRAADEIERLRAKIEQMERQEPVAWTTKLALRHGANALGFDACAGNLWGEKGVPLYALPGAHPAPSVPDDIVREVLRDCCGTFHGSRHRITCEKYKGKRDQETSCEDE